MATPLFRPTIEEAFQRFLEEEEPHATRTMLDQYRDVLEYFKQFLNQEGRETLPEALRPRSEEAARRGEAFIQAFHTPQILPAVPAFLQDLAYQKSLLPPGMLTNAEKTLHKLGRWLLARELGLEADYLTALEAMPHLRDQLDPAEEMSSLIFDHSREDPPMGKVLDEVKGYVEIIRVHKGALTVYPIVRTDIRPYVKVTQEASSLARAGWWIDAHLVQTPSGWQFIDIGNVLP